MTLEAQLQAATVRSFSPSEVKRAIQLLKQGADPNAFNGTVFRDAAGSGNETLVRAFLSHGAKVTPQALESAISGPLWEDGPKTQRITEILLNHGADPNATVSYRPFTDEDIEVTPVLYTPLMVAVVEDNLDAAKLLVERGAKPQTQLPNGLTALKVAAQQQKSSFCKFLLNHGVDFRGAQQNLLKIAIKGNDVALFDRLKKLGALPQPLKWPNEFYTLSLPMAQRMLAAGASPNANGIGHNRGRSPLDVATINKDWPLVQFLQDKGAKIESSALTDAIPDRRLSQAEVKEKEEYLEAIQKQQSVFDDYDPHVFEEEKQALAENRHEDLRGLQLFLQHGADPNLPYTGPPIPVEATDKRYLRKFTDPPLHVAASRNRKGAIALLLRAGAKIEVKNGLGMTPLLTAAEALSDEAVPVLLDAGANIEARDEEGNTPLLLASAYRASATIYAPLSMTLEAGDSLPVAQLLLQRGADVKATNSRGLTALHHAAGIGNIPFIRLLLEKGAMLEATTSEGITPLGAASWSGQLEAARLLLEHGADPDFPAPSGHTPRQIASQLFTMEVKVMGETNSTSRPDRQTQQLVEAYSAPIRAGRQKIAALFRTIPEKKTENNP